MSVQIHVLCQACGETGQVAIVGGWKCSRCGHKEYFGCDTVANPRKMVQPLASGQFMVLGYSLSVTRATALRDELDASIDAAGGGA